MTVKTGANLIKPRGKSTCLYLTNYAFKSLLEAKALAF